MNKTKLFKFALVGSVGFIADILTFSLLYKVCDLEIMQARVLAFIVAATVTWIGNRCYTFHANGTKNKLKQWCHFLAVACFSAIPNFLVFKAVVNLIGLYFLGVYIALGVGVLAGMLSNFLLSEKWVFKPTAL